MATKKQTNKEQTKVKKYYSRKFLNKDKGVDALETFFEFNPGWLYGGGWEGTVTISDCYKASTLDFSCYTVKDIDNAINKVSLILAEFEKLGNLMLEYREAAIENIKKSDEDRKKRSSKRALKAVMKDLGVESTDGA